ncbi:MAG: hypothetical protein NXI20_28105 [bacterium]|nr:hypothetical protein [bacterium]
MKKLFKPFRTWGIFLFVLTMLQVVSYKNSEAQVLRNNIPTNADSTDRFLFYLHGGIIQDMGINAKSPRYGTYEYTTILDSLVARGFVVISERRMPGTIEAEYAGKMSLQIDSLLEQGVPKKNIFVVGASLGAYVAIELAKIRKDEFLNYALLGLCSDYAIDLYKPDKNQLCGNFLSIYEASDKKKSCYPLLEVTYCKQGYKEVRLNMGNGHGFLYKPYTEWLEPIAKWANKISE